MNKDLYNNVKALCKENGVSVVKMESDLGFPQSSIRKWKKSEPGIWKVKKVADYLGVRIDELIA